MYIKNQKEKTIVYICEYVKEKEKGNLISYFYKEEKIKRNIKPKLSQT